MADDDNLTEEYLAYAEAQLNLWKKREADCQRKAEIWKRQINQAKLQRDHNQSHHLTAKGV